MEKEVSAIYVQVLREQSLPLPPHSRLPSGPSSSTNGGTPDRPPVIARRRTREVQDPVPTKPPAWESSCPSAKKDAKANRRFTRPRLRSELKRVHDERVAVSFQSFGQGGD